MTRKASRAESAAIPPKIVFPHPANIYLRERLFDLLDRTRQDHRVIWMSAPGGAGKTSLAASYLSARKLPVLWYQVDQGDGDIASFFYYMGLAAKQAAPRYKHPLPVLTPEYLGDIPTFTRNFFRELYRRLRKNSVLVLDNYQDAPEDSLLHDVLHTAMSEVPEGINLLVLSRVEPPAVLARLRLCDHAACLDWDKIQLTREETAGLARLRAGCERPDPKTIDTLYARTEGWAAGVVLMLEQSRSGELPDIVKLPAGQKLLFDYFAGEILNRSEPVTREFLLKTALFPKVSAEAARALTGVEQARDILDDLMRRNYFTVRHDGPDGDTYQYHPLFREFLLTGIEKNYTQDVLRGLRQHAARLLVHGGQLEAAALLMQQTHDHPELAMLALSQAPALLVQGRHDMLAAWLTALPPDVHAANPWLTYWLGVCRLPFDPLESRQHLEQAYTRFHERSDIAGLYLAWSGIVETFIYLWDDFSPLIPWVNKFERLRREYPAIPDPAIEARAVYGAAGAYAYTDSYSPHTREWIKQGEAILSVSSDANFVCLFGSTLVFYYLMTGDFERQAYILQHMRRVKMDPAISPLARIMARLAEASHYGLLGDVERCKQAGLDGLAIAEQTGVHIMDGILHYQLVLAYGNDNDIANMSVMFERFKSMTNPYRRLDVAQHYAGGWWIASLKGRFGDALQQVRAGLQLGQLMGSGTMVHLMRFCLAQSLVDLGQFDAAREELASIAAVSRHPSHPLCHSQYLLCDAWLAYREGDAVRCAGTLVNLFAFAREQNHLVYSFWCPYLVAPLCAIALARDIEPDFVRSLIRQRRLPPPSDIPATDLWPYPIKLYTLGRFAVVVDDKPLSRSAGHKKPIELLQALVALGGREVDEGKLAENLWPEAEGDAARQNLKVNVHRLRKLLPEGAIVWVEGKLSLDSRQTWVDLWALERELGRLDQSSPADVQEQVSLVDRVLSLYRGEFLSGSTAPWALATRERLRNKTLRVVARAAESLGQRDPAAAVPIYEKATELDPLRESIYQDLMRCHRQLRQPAEGLRTYQRCRDTLRRELSVDPSPATEALHQALKTGQ